mmetsp:Transcript_17000/g.30896  ORF Transcript_17000/g.30896 Transcript_17000/m.30896 type:complete len:122 (-) Transcript_17000:564-929(-)
MASLVGRALTDKSTNNDFNTPSLPSQLDFSLSPSTSARQLPSRPVVRHVPWRSPVGLRVLTNSGDAPTHPTAAALGAEEDVEEAGGGGEGGEAGGGEGELREGEWDLDSTLALRESLGLLG